MSLGLFDVDNHYYETRDCFTRHIEPAMRERAVRVERDAAGVERGIGLRDLAHEGGGHNVILNSHFCPYRNPYYLSPYYL